MKLSNVKMSSRIIGSSAMLLRTIVVVIVVIIVFIALFVVLIYSAIRLSSRKCAVNSVFSVQ